MFLGYRILQRSPVQQPCQTRYVLQTRPGTLPAPVTLCSLFIAGWCDSLALVKEWCPVGGQASSFQNALQCAFLEELVQSL